METFLVFRSASSETWMRIADVGSWMVVIGVFAEVLEFFIKIAELRIDEQHSKKENLTILLAALEHWKKASISVNARRAWYWCQLRICRFLILLKEHKLWEVLWGLFWLLVVVLGLVIELGSNQRARRIDGRDNAEWHRRASSNELEVARLNKEISPRRLTGIQKEQFSKLILPAPAKGYGIVIVSTMFDPESEDFADDLDSAFHGGHWETSRVRNFAGNWYGLSISTVAGTQIADAKRVSDALTAIEVPNSFRTPGGNDRHKMVPDFEMSVLYLVVGHKPPLKQGQSAIK